MHNPTNELDLHVYPDFAGRKASAGLPTVLIVEADTTVARRIERLARNHGMNTVTLGSNREAVQLLSERAFDVVFASLDAETHDGLEVLRIARKVRREVCFIFMTETPTVEGARWCIRRHVFDYLHKPLEVRELTTVLERAVDSIVDLRLSEQTAQESAGVYNTLKRDFVGALANLWIAFQPITDAQTGDVLGYEALMRSHSEAMPHPGGLLQAGEDLGLLTQLGRSVRELAAKRYMEERPDGVLFVNLHPRELLDPLLYDLNAPLSRIAHNVVLEITERMALTAIHDLEERIQSLRAMGFQIAVDDLGSGYAGLTTLVTLSPDIVKLDMTLVRGLDHLPLQQQIVKSLMHMAQSLGIRVVAEGVETEEEHQVLVELGCDMLQGFLLGRPHPEFLPARRFPTMAMGATSHPAAMR